MTEEPEQVQQEAANGAAEGHRAAGGAGPSSEEGSEEDHPSDLELSTGGDSDADAAAPSDDEDGAGDGSEEQEGGPEEDPELLLDAFKERPDAAKALGGLLAQVQDPAAFLQPRPALASATRAAAAALYAYAVHALLAGTGKADRQELMAAVGAAPAAAAAARAGGKAPSLTALVPQLCAGPEFDAEQIWVQVGGWGGLFVGGCGLLCWVCVGWAGMDAAWGWGCRAKAA